MSCNLPSASGSVKQSPSKVKPVSASNTGLFGRSSLNTSKALSNSATEPTTPASVWGSGVENRKTSPIGFREYKVEKLRFRDYLSEPNGNVLSVTDHASSQQISSQEGGNGTPELLDRRARTELLEGSSAVEVVVGCSAIQLTRAWSLSRALCSHYSLVLRNTCNRLLYDNQGILCITLPEEIPIIFALFVEYMIQGTYTVPTPSRKMIYTVVSTDAQAWVLGDKLQALEFKNYAMECLYAQHVSGTKAFTLVDVDYAFSKSAPGSKLRLFYKHLLAAYISRPERVSGSQLEWYSLLKDHEDQLGSLSSLRSGGGQEKPRMHKLEYYKDVKKVGSNIDAKAQETGAVVPAKRKADGEAVGDGSGM